VGDLQAERASGLPEGAADDERNAEDCERLFWGPDGDGPPGLGAGTGARGPGAKRINAGTSGAEASPDAGARACTRTSTRAEVCAEYVCDRRNLQAKRFARKRFDEIVEPKLDQGRLCAQRALKREFHLFREGRNLTGVLRVGWRFTQSLLGEALLEFQSFFP